jgi:myo-inositol 2-dehydrogenase / D-chiro-inositol 1-dehydrogenase
VPEAPAVPLALAGAGWMAAVHAMAVEPLPDAAITAVASRQPERAGALAQRLGASACAYDDLPATARGVIVATPPALHAAHALAAVDAGVAALVEKPLCATLADADRLVAAAEAGAVLGYAENLVHAPVVRQALGHAAQLEGIDVLEVRAIQPRPTWGDFLTEAWGGGVLFDLGPHPLALALLLAAPARPVEVQATLAGADDHPVDEHAEVGLRFDDGALARVVASWRGDGSPVWDAQASAPDGVVRFELLPQPLLERNGVEVRLPPLPPDVPAPLVQLGYLEQARSFVADVVAGRPPALGPAFGRSVLDVICAAYASAAAGGSWVPLPFQGDRAATPLQLWRR